MGYQDDQREGFLKVGSVNMGGCFRQLKQIH